VRDSGGLERAKGRDGGDLLYITIIPLIFVVTEFIALSSWPRELSGIIFVMIIL